MSALTAQTGTKMLHVPYRGNSQALTDGLGGVVELLVINDVVLPHWPAARSSLAVMAPQRPAWPDVPTMAELKLPQLQYYSNFGVSARLSPAVVQSVQAALAKATASAQQRRGAAARGQRRAAAGGDGAATPGRLAGRAHHGELKLPQLQYY